MHGGEAGHFPRHRMMTIRSRWKGLRQMEFDLCFSDWAIPQSMRGFRRLFIAKIGGWDANYRVAGYPRVHDPVRGQRLRYAENPKN